MKVLIRADASIAIGSGHLMRCLTLADQLRNEGAEVVFVCRDTSDAMFDLLQSRGYRFAKLPTTETNTIPQKLDAKETIEASKQLFSAEIDWLVVDHYELDADWERMLRPCVHKIMVIDDLANRMHDCDLLLDQNYYRDQDRRYQGLLPNNCVTLLGPKYVLLRPEFSEARQRIRSRDGNIRNILVFFGSSDPTNQTQKAIEGLMQFDKPDINVDVVVGVTNPNLNIIQELCAQSSNVTFHCQVSNMAELILKADLGIGAGGSAMWERCYLGLPTITVVFASNQVRTTEDVAEIGAIKYLGWSDQLSSKDYAQAITLMIEDTQKVRQIGNSALGLLQAGTMSFASMMHRLALGFGAASKSN